MTMTNHQLQAEARWCQDALQVQNASNSSGIAHSLQKIFTEMCDYDIPTRSRNTHPAVKLFINKLADLSGMVCDYPLDAEELCIALIKHAKEQP